VGVDLFSKQTNDFETEREIDKRFVNGKKNKRMISEQKEKQTSTSEHREKQTKRLRTEGETDIMIINRRKTIEHIETERKTNKRF